MNTSDYLYTDRLQIRPFSLDDYPFIIELLNEPQFIENIADNGIHSRKDAETYLENGPLRSYRADGFGLNMIELRDSQSPIGMCGLILRSEFDHPDIGYAILSKFCGKGYATEAAGHLLRNLRKNSPIKKVLAVTFPDNLPSNRLLTKLGFNLIGKRMLYGRTNNLYELLLS